MEVKNWFQAFKLLLFQIRLVALHWGALAGLPEWPTWLVHLLVRAAVGEATAGGEGAGGAGGGEGGGAGAAGAGAGAGAGSTATGELLDMGANLLVGLSFPGGVRLVTWNILRPAAGEYRD